MIILAIKIMVIIIIIIIIIFKYSYNNYNNNDEDCQTQYQRLNWLVTHNIIIIIIITDINKLTSSNKTHARAQWHSILIGWRLNCRQQVFATRLPTDWVTTTTQKKINDKLTSLEWVKNEWGLNESNEGVRIEQVERTSEDWTSRTKDWGLNESNERMRIEQIERTSEGVQNKPLTPWGRSFRLPPRKSWHSQSRWRYLECI